MQQEKHFTIEDFEKYMDTADLSEEYLWWYQEKVAHIDNCPMCQKILDRMLQLEAVSEEENWSEGLQLLEQEEAIRSRLVAQKLILAGQEERMRRVIAMLYGNQVAPTLVYRNDFLKKASVARGALDKAGAKGAQEETLQVEYAEGRIRVKVTSKEPKEFTVIIQPAKMHGTADTEEPLIATAVWSAQENAAVAEVKVDKLAEEYRIYLA